MSFKNYINEIMGLPSSITGAGPISNHGEYIDKMITKLKRIQINPQGDKGWEKKRVKLAKKAMSDLESLRKLLNTIHYGKYN